MFDFILTTDFYFSILRLTTPVLFASLAALTARQSGVTNMGIEGIMLFSALFGVIGSSITNSVIGGLLFAIIIGIFMGLVIAFFKIKMKVDELLVGIAINLLAAGATVFLLYLYSGDKASSSSVPSKVVPVFNIPILSKIPVVGKIFFSQNILVYISLISVAVMYYLLYRTPLGLRIRAVGGNPGAAVSVGVSVNKIQYISLAISGFLASLGGAFMSMGYMTIFTRNMTSGRGFIGLAAANVGGQNPIGAFFASLMFGFFETLGNNLQSFNIPVEYIYMIPYITTILAFTYSSYRSLKRRQINKEA